ncbi:unnamed protein product [Rotaria sp. Silwood1]|nr:unnamed protein product [Rotaria sp. Silwood1]CAF3844187.1 unnamed protein product [Rotaria sp. Silwood1]CAF3882431.1 unnamed protein product [Rotaria sp. Silwood1]CAF4903376.1 unnamed protein product [Rotaria sp. Silwood1]CAF4925072.1 unnamed protein product [Rotaria sp. Silwood1]
MSNFWQYSNKNGFDLTRQNNHQACSPICFETTTTPIIIDPARSALIIIDMQNCFLHPALMPHETGLIASEQLLKYAIPAARKAGIQILWLNWGLTDEDIDQAPPALKRLFAYDCINTSENVPTQSNKIYKGFGTSIGEVTLPNGDHVDGGRLLMRDTWNAKLYDPLFQSYESSQSTAKPDKCFHKNRPSGLWAHNSPLLSYLHDNKIITIFFAGVNTDQCVSGTLQDAFNKGFDCILLRDGCGTTSPSFATECIEYNCALGCGFIMTTEAFDKGIKASQH